jgi:hypothetical protein
MFTKENMGFKVKRSFFSNQNHKPFNLIDDYRKTLVAFKIKVHSNQVKFLNNSTNLYMIFKKKRDKA